MANTSQLAPIALTSSQLEQWFADIEKGNGSTAEADSSLAAKFLARFGLQEVAQVIEFLKTAGGNETVNMIAQEIMKEEAQIQFIREKNAEELLRQQQLLFLLMSYIAKNKAHAEQVSEQTQQQDERRLQETRAEGKKESSSITTHMVVADARADKLQKLDKELKELENGLLEEEEQLEELEDEMLLMEETHAYLTDSMEVFHSYLQAPLFNNEPITDYVTYANQQVERLSAQLTILRAQQAMPTPTDSSDVTQPQRIKARIDRKARMIEDQCSFYQAQLQKPPQTHEQALQEMIEHTQRLLLNESFTNDEGLILQKNGLVQALDVKRGNKILLNPRLERVYDFSQGQLIIEPSQMSRFRRYGDSYAYFSEDITPERQLNDQDWLQAILNYEKSKPDICTVNFFYNDRMKHDVESLRMRTQSCQSRAQALMDRIDKVQATKMELLPEKTPFSMTPKPQSKSSYSLMLERLVPSHAPAPRPQDILNARSKLEAVVPPERKDALEELISEVRPGEIMPPERRFSWFNRFHRLMPDIPVPESDEESRLKYKK